jgi:hypothetical protein
MRIVDCERRIVVADDLVLGSFTALAVLRMYEWRSLDHHGQLPLEWLGSELASFEALLATRRGEEGGWKKVMKPQNTPAVEAVAADVHLGYDE